MKMPNQPAVIEAQKLAAQIHAGGSYVVVDGKPVPDQPAKAAESKTKKGDK